ncbi:MAG: hypothetical protein KDB21_06730 [Acidimicrobiales bacterium]|nr:hypothetical protein [Acidimicrobiales bacterium]
MHKLLASTLLGAGVVGGSLAVAVASPLGVAVAQEAPVDAGASPDGAAHGPAHLLQQALENLQADGTLTSEQAQAVSDEVAGLAAEWREDHPGLEDRRDRRGDRREGRRETIETVSELLGMPADEVAAALRDGATLADLAGDDVGAVIDALVSAGTERVEAAVDAGRLPQEKADELLADLEQRVTALVNGDGRP